jgi:hypothetical protein
VTFGFTSRRCANPPNARFPILIVGWNVACIRLLVESAGRTLAHTLTAKDLHALKDNLQFKHLQYLLRLQRNVTTDAPRRRSRSASLL